MYMIFFVLDDPSLLNKILAGWEAAGIGGATIVESSGLHRRTKHLPMRYSFDSGMEEEGHLTLFAIVPDEDRVQACLAATEVVTGNLDDPNTGVFAAWPLSSVKGVPTTGA
jgi:hypothetical protein